MCCNFHKPLSILLLSTLLLAWKVQATHCSAADTPCTDATIFEKAQVEQQLLHSPVVQAQQPRVLIFVSLAMPEQSLRLWSEQALSLGLPLRIRGFFGESLPSTTHKISTIFGQRAQAEILIDPEAFKTFDIQVVPAVAVVLPAQEHSALDPKPPALFALVYGDTSLDAALDLVSRKAPKEITVVAQQFLQRLRVQAKAQSASTKARS